MSLRRIAVLIGQLPRESALGRALNPEQWDALKEVVASVWDATVAMNWPPNPADKNKAQPKWTPPPTYPRPGQEQAQQSRDDAIRQKAAAWRANKAKSRG